MQQLETENLRAEVRAKLTAKLEKMCRQEEENARKKDEDEIDEAYIAGLIGKIDEHEAAEKLKKDALA